LGVILQKPSAGQDLLFVSDHDFGPIITTVELSDGPLATDKAALKDSLQCSAINQGFH
jgi:hypothetical protein